MEVKRLPLRIPKELWIALRRAQEDGIIKSINQAAIDGLRKILKERRK